LFGQNRGDVVVPSTFDAPAVAKPEDPNPPGLVGVGSYGTRVEYTDLVVTGPDGRKLSADNLLKDAGQWKFTHGRWSVEDGVVRPQGSSQQTWALTGEATWTNYTVTLRARKLSGDEGFIVLWHAADGDNYRWWNLGGWANTVSRCEFSENGGREPYGPSAPFTVETGRWYDLKLEVNGHTARGYVDGKLVMEATDEANLPAAAAFASASYINATGELIVKVVNSADQPLEAEIHLANAREVGAGKAIVLSGEPSAVNSIANPANVAPKEEPLTNASASFTRTFPAHSVTLLRFPAKK
jgi:alpha-L-arabinofuranosidase